MAGGVPTVASDIGENRYIVLDQETGFLVRRPEEWEKYLERLCTDPELRTRMGEKGRKRVESFYDLPIAVSGYAQVLRKLIASDPR
jgi:glycosyltransferase involved in cell wall biosynthesis